MGRLIDNVRGHRAKELLEHISVLFTKEEVIAMLTEIQLEIEELDYITFDGITKRRCLEIIEKYKAEAEEE